MSHRAVKIVERETLFKQSPFVRRRARIIITFGSQRAERERVTFYFVSYLQMRMSSGRNNILVSSSSRSITSRLRAACESSVGGGGGGCTWLEVAARETNSENKESFLRRTAAILYFRASFELILSARLIWGSLTTAAECFCPVGSRTS